ncbi:putative ABC transporter permease protein YurN [Bacillus sp. J14TS2]|uniref:carbohydrate ABC transporter permease n=1 Tax=Bacillus sp. J14TS2 TaxID=2807188 RepID=UPI001B2BAC2D|nr:sugar ABC transporter permease [Bacillus sp. J14TS2]GIN71437.1 putative ABC transporter permease protein YurN [Bacillus sp. J14TS2]
MIKERFVPYLFLIPALVLILVFKIYPIFDSLKESLFIPSFLAGEKIFAGFDNYLMLFEDPVFWNSVKVTLYLNVFINPLQIILAFLLAIFLNRQMKGIGIFRAIHFIPIAVSMPIALIMWNVMLNPEQGIFNTILVALGFEPQPFLGSSDQAMWIIIMIATWKGVGYWAIFLLAGLQEVPKNLYEAAAIDGAGKWQQFINITFQMMKRPLAFVAVADTVANFLLFAPMYILTNGGPKNSTNVLMNESYNSAFVYSDMGRASAINIIILLILLVVIAIEFKFLKAKH